MYFFDDRAYIKEEPSKIEYKAFNGDGALPRFGLGPQRKDLKKFGNSTAQNPKVNNTEPMNIGPNAESAVVADATKKLFKLSEYITRFRPDHGALPATGQKVAGNQEHMELFFQFVVQPTCQRAKVTRAKLPRQQVGRAEA